MVKHPKRPRDLSQLAKLIVDITTGERPNDSRPEPETAARASRRKGGLKGGKARAKKLSPTRRKRIAAKAARARWRKS